MTGNGTKTNRANKPAVERALSAWRAKTGQTRPAGFDEKEAALITGVSLAELGDLVGLAGPSILVDLPDGSALIRYDVFGLLRLAIVAELRRAGVSVLVLALVARDLKEEYEDEGRDELRKVPGAARLVLAYPLSVQLAEHWLLGDGRVDRAVWTRPQMVAGDDSAADAARFAEMTIEVAEVRGCLERGEAASVRRWEVQDRLVDALDAFWVEHVAPAPRPTGRDHASDAGAGGRE